VVRTECRPPLQGVKASQENRILMKGRGRISRSLIMDMKVAHVCRRPAWLDPEPVRSAGTVLVWARAGYAALPPLGLVDKLMDLCSNLRLHATVSPAAGREII
jgi:hypothetical protein